MTDESREGAEPVSVPAAVMEPIMDPIEDKEPSRMAAKETNTEKGMLASEPTPGSLPALGLDSALNWWAFAQANASACFEAMRSAIEYGLGVQRANIEFAGKRALKIIGLGQALRDAPSYQNMVRASADYRRGEVDDYMKHSHAAVEAALAVMRDSMTPLRNRVDAAMDRMRQAA